MVDILKYGHKFGLLPTSNGNLPIRGPVRLCGSGGYDYVASSVNNDRDFAYFMLKSETKYDDDPVEIGDIVILKAIRKDQDAGYVTNTTSGSIECGNIIKRDDVTNDETDAIYTILTPQGLRTGEQIKYNKSDFVLTTDLNFMYSTCYEDYIDGCGYPIRFSDVSLEDALHFVAIKGCDINSNCQESPNLYCYEGLCMECDNNNVHNACGEGMICFHGQCAECRVDGDCPDNFACSDNGMCYQCLNDSHCGENVCVGGICKECNFASGEGDYQCQDRFGENRPFCRHDNTCVQCDDNKGCDQNQTCTADGYCVECEDNTNCNDKPGRPICSNNMCVECLADSACDIDRGFYCNNSKCVQCVTNIDCSNNEQVPPGMNTCYNGICGQCDANGGCGDNHVCNIDTHRCVDCITNVDCENPNYPHCNTENNTCVQCKTESDCGDTMTCTSIGTCVDCITDENCIDIDPKYPICTSYGKCVECDNTLSETGCLSEKPVCTDIGFCVECLTDENCTDDLICVNYKCMTQDEECIDDYDCYERYQGDTPYICNRGTCVTNSEIKCTAYYRCEDYEVCTIDYECKDVGDLECVSHEDCNTIFDDNLHACMDGVCIRVDCLVDRDCPNNNVCTSDYKCQELEVEIVESGWRIWGIIAISIILGLIMIYVFYEIKNTEPTSMEYPPPTGDNDNQPYAYQNVSTEAEIQALLNNPPNQPYLDSALAQGKSYFDSLFDDTSKNKYKPPYDTKL